MAGILILKRPDDNHFTASVLGRMARAMALTDFIGFLSFAFGIESEEEILAILRGVSRV